MSFLLATAAKDWKRQRRDPAALLLWIGIPLLVGGLMTMLAGGREGPRPQAHVLIVDRDDSFLSNFLVGALSQEGAGDFVRAERVTEEDGRERIADGDGTALLVIPDGFAAAVLREEPCALELVTNPTQRVLPGIVEETLSMFAEVVFYLHRFLGDDLREMADGPGEGRRTFADERIAELSVRINRLVEGLDGTLFPPVIEVVYGDPESDVDETVEDAAGARADSALALAEEAGRTKEEEDEPARGIALLFLPGLLFMSMLFMAQGLSADLWQEREQRTLRRVVTSPATAHSFLGGKILFGMLLMGGVAAIALGAGFAYYGLPFLRFPVAVAWSAVSGGFLLVLLMLIQLVSPTQRAGSVFAMVLIFPLMMLGGSFFPFEAMPDWMVRVGRLTPNGWALTRLVELLRGDAEPGALLASLGGLAAVGGALFLLAGARLRTAFVRG